MTSLLCPISIEGESQTVDSDVVNVFVETWLSVHDDIRWFFLRDLRYVCWIVPQLYHLLAVCTDLSCKFINTILSLLTTLSPS